MSWPPSRPERPVRSVPRDFLDVAHLLSDEKQLIVSSGHYMVDSEPAAVGCEAAAGAPELLAVNEADGEASSLSATRTQRAERVWPPWRSSISWIIEATEDRAGLETVLVATFDSANWCS
jgi:hypothetical protein